MGSVEGRNNMSKREIYKFLVGAIGGWLFIAVPLILVFKLSNFPSYLIGNISGIIGVFVVQSFGEKKRD